MPRLRKFSRNHPDVSIDLAVDDGLVDIVAERFDCGVRHDNALQADMISVRISGPLQPTAAFLAFLKAMREF